MKKFFSSLFVGFFALTAFASDEAEMLAKLRSNFPSIPFTAVFKTPSPGIFEVNMDKDVLYVDSTGIYFFPTMVDMRTRINIGDERRAELNRVDFSTLPLADAIKTVNGNGKRKIAVFADPNCGFCKRMERNFLSLKDTTIYTYPVGILGQDSINKSTAVSCATGDKSKAWKAMMLEGATPVARTCDNGAVARNLELFKRMGFQGTPSIIYENGRTQKGFVENDKIEAMFAIK
jgi:thiol:disulfide interchange protein DsbC